MPRPSEYKTANLIGVKALKGFQYVFGVAGALAVADDQTLRLIVGQDCRGVEVYAYAKTAPTGQALNLEIEAKTGAAAWRTIASPSISAGANSDEDTISQPLYENDQLRLNVDQVGSVIAGSDLSVFLRVMI